MTSLPSVLLLEDDPFMQHFVQLALEDLPVQLHCSSNLAQARHLLRTQPLALLLSDMQLPDGSAATLCVELNANPTAWAGPVPRVVMFSGGIDPTLEPTLRSSGVWQVLHKPVTMEQLQNCVVQALAQQPSTPTTPLSTDTAQRQHIYHFFGDRHTLFAAYQHTCLQQFAHDLVEGQRAAQAGDWIALRHLAHNLKSVLTLLGHPLPAQLARELEAQASTGNPAIALATWEQLQIHLLQLLQLESPEV